MILGRDRRRLEEAEKRLAELDDSYRRVVELEADWQDWLHKIRNVLARLNQRERDAAPEEPTTRNGRPGVLVTNPAARRLLGMKEE